jgi:hypothetical protein
VESAATAARPRGASLLEMFRRPDRHRSAGRSHGRIAVIGRTYSIRSPLVNFDRVGNGGRMRASFAADRPADTVLPSNRIFCSAL